MAMNLRFHTELGALAQLRYLLCASTKPGETRATPKLCLLNQTSPIPVYLHIKTKPEGSAPVGVERVLGGLNKVKPTSKIIFLIMAQ